MRKKILLPLFLLTLFVTYQVSITVFTHVHYINGVMVVHSHPAKDKHHTHAPTQVILLSNLSTFHTPKAELGSSYCLVERPLLYLLKDNYVVPCVKGIFLINLTLRAPPMNA